MCFDKGLKLAPDDARLWLAKGACLAKLRHWDAAVDAYRRGISLEPAYSEADARLMLAEALVKAGRTSEAKKEYQVVAEMEASYPSYEGPIDEAEIALRRLGKGKGR